MTERLSHPTLDHALDAAEAADIWLVRREGGHDIEADPAFVAWLVASSDNAKAWAEGVRLWDAVGAAAESDPLLDAMRRDALMARPAAAPSWTLRAAAVVGVLLVAGVLAWTNLSPLSHPAQNTPWVAVNTPSAFSNGAAPPRTVVLGDGTHVTLDAGSSIAVAYDGSHRAVRLLRGRAFFDVVHDPQHPFRVEADDRWVDDIGTEFEVRLAARAITVALVKGKVTVGSTQAPTPLALTPGQQVEIGADGVEQITSINPDADLGWRSGVIVFQDTTVEQAIAEVNGYGGPPVVASGLGDLRVSGRFRVGDPKAFAHTLAEIYPIRVHDQPDGGARVERAD